MATLLSRQNPMARSGRAWWPGGRSARNAPSPSAPVSASTAARPAPAARTAAGHDPADIEVSGSIVPPPCSARASSRSTCRRVCTLVISSAVASRGGSGVTRASVSPPASRAAWSMPACTASSRAGRSGWPRPGSWSTKHGSTPTNSMLSTVPGVLSRLWPPRPSRSRRLRSRVAMSPLNSHTLRWGGGWARIGPFRSGADVARLTMGTDAPPSPSVIERCLGEVQARSYKAVVTNALGPAESAPFVDAGFAVRERLHLLAHDLDRLPPATGSTRRARRHDYPAVLDLDATAFDGDWHLDRDGLVEALRATPVTRFRITPDSSTTLSGYAVTGRSGRNGYLQRIAVRADARNRGFGRTLIADALWWLRRRAVERALVNTQLDNTAAISLYESCGFRRLPIGLCVLGRTL